MDFFFDGMFNEGGMPDDEIVASESDGALGVLEDTPYLLRTSDYWQQIPLPAGMCTGGTDLLNNLDDDTLLTMSPSLIAHVQRTEASGGIQIVSPRQVTLGGVAGRTAETKRTTDMFLVGSAANRNYEWPTVDGPVPDHLFWREPIDAYPAEPAARPKTVSSGVLSSTHGIHDPITKAFLVGRALVDLQRRSDVNGDAEELAAVLAACWGLDADVYTSMGEASLAPVGDLLRYAIRSDTVYPAINAPVQAKRVVSVGANTAGRLLYGEYSAIDWRRMRVLAESVFYQTSRLEGHTLGDMVAPLPPGNPRAPPVRPGILQFRPMPGSVWTFDPTSFTLDVSTDVVIPGAARMPERVGVAVAQYHANARVLVSAVDHGVELSATVSTKRTPARDNIESLISGYKTLITMNTVFSARGRTSAAAVRGFIYDALATNTSLPAVRALWVIRHVGIEAKALGIGHLLDHVTTSQVASRMAELTADLRIKLAVEAGRRGVDLDTWWEDIKSTMPAEIKRMREGSGSWGLAAAHLLLHPVTDRWVKLTSALAHASHQAMAAAHLSGVRLPAVIGSEARIYGAASATARRLGASYGAYYGAMHDVACILADRLARAGNRAGAEKLRLAGGLWKIRARVASTVQLHMDEPVSRAAGTVSYGQPGRDGSGEFAITTSPYSAYKLWHTAVNSSPFVSRDAKAQFPHRTGGIVSTCFAGKSVALFRPSTGQSARVYRYAIDPSRLAADIERTLTEIRNDIALVATHYWNEQFEIQATSSAKPAVEMEVVGLNIDLASFRPAAGSYWDLVGKMDPDDAVALVDALARLDDSISADIEGRTYESAEELLEVAWAAVDGVALTQHAARDVVR